MCSEEQIQTWAAEADTGYDVAELKRRGRGRPGRGAEAMQVVTARLTAEELEAWDAAAEADDLSRSTAGYHALSSCISAGGRRGTRTPDPLLVREVL